MRKVVICLVFLAIPLVGYSDPVPNKFGVLDTYTQLSRYGSQYVPVGKPKFSYYFSNPKAVVSVEGYVMQDKTNSQIYFTIPNIHFSGTVSTDGRGRKSVIGSVPVSFHGVTPADSWSRNQSYSFALPEIGRPEEVIQVWSILLQPGGVDYYNFNYRGKPISPPPSATPTPAPIAE